MTGAFARRAEGAGRAPRRDRAAGKFAAALAAGLAGVLGTAVPAGLAAGAAGATSGLFHSRHWAHANETWGGFAVTGSTYTSISGSWTIPALACSAGTGAVSPWIGIDGWVSNTVEQIGLDLDCSTGVASYHPWVEMYPGGPSYFAETVRAGDTIVASVEASANSWWLTESDPTEHWSQKFHRTGSYARSSAEAIVEDLGNPSVPPPVDDFGTVTFTNLAVDGHPFFTAGIVNVTSLERGTVALSRAARLSTNACSVTWLHR